MDRADPQLLTKVLEPNELEQIPSEVQQKLLKYIDGLISEYCTEKAAGTLLHNYEEKTEDLQNQIQDYQEKLKNFELNVNELRSQLDKVSEERAQLIEKANRHELDVVNLRKEKNDVVEERDSLLKLLERQNSEISLLKQDMQSLQQQLNAATIAKCEAIARLDEVESKEMSLQLKERRLEQEHSVMQNEIQLLKADLNRNQTEMQNMRRDSTVHGLHLETQLTEKIEELRIIQGQNEQYKKSIEDLNDSMRKLSERMLEQKEESDKLLDTYRKELEMKSKLIDIYKGSLEDNDNERNELVGAIAELKRMLHDATESYDALEALKRQEVSKCEDLIKEKTEQIDALKKELLHANDLLKEVQHESVESAISKLAPTAAIANRLIRTDMSLTELYSLYAKTCEDLEAKKRENSSLNHQIKTILAEFSERAPLIEKQENEYKKLIEANSVLAQQRDELLAKKHQTDSVLGEIEIKVNHLNRENKRLKRLRDDMNRQLVCLLNEVEHLRIGIEPNKPASVGSMSTSEEIISKKLVTYTSIDEVLEHNQKLLVLVRDLTNQVEENENQKRAFDEAAFKEKLDGYAKKIQNMQEALNQKSEALTNLVAKCERYKKMYFEMQKSLGKQNHSGNLDDSMIDMDADVSMKNDDTIKSDKGKKETTDTQTELRLRSLEQQLQSANEKYKSLKEQYDYYKTEKQNNDKLFQDQFDSMRNEVRELTSTNCKVMNALEFHKEHGVLLQKNIVTYKQQIEALEQRTKSYETTIIKHEQTVRLLKDEILSVQRRHATAEAEANHLRHENRILKDATSRLQAEKEGFNREHQNQALLLNNLELIKSNLEKSETDIRLRLEKRLDDTMRELSAQRRHFKEEEDRFRETINEYKRQTETARKQMEDEKAQADKLRAELVIVREELTSKIKQIDELSKKLQESLTPSQKDNPITAANKKARDFENKYEEAKLEIAALTNELAKAREHGEQFYKMSQSAESEIRRIHEMHTAYIKSAEQKIEEFKKSEAELKNKISDLEADIMLVNVTERSKDTNQTDQLKNTQEELKNSLQKLTDANSTIRALRAENTSLSESLAKVEKKYANEMVLHSSDIEQACSLKAELTKVQDQIKDLTSGRDQALAAFEELKRTNEESRKLLQNEKEEYEKRVADLNALNASLHDQIEALTSKLYVLSQSTLNQSNSTFNESAMDTSGSDLNQSKLEAENKNNEQLLQIIKILRKEKDLSVAKLDIVKAECIRLASEHTILQKKVDELNGFLNQERSKSESDVISTTKHEEILRKIETINALTDSNRILREERNGLSERVKQLNDRISSIEEELFPLKKQNTELTSKIEEITAENSTYRTEVIKWRQRANALVEKSNKNPEEFKRLQMERENLAKMLTHEKEVLKKTQDELAQTKSRLESEIPTLTKRVQALTEDNRKLNEDLVALKQANVRMTNEIMELKHKLLLKEEELQKANEELQSKENQLVDLRNKELQIRKIAKRYKDSYTELCSKNMTGENSLDIGGNNVVEDNGNNANELENLRSQVENLNSTVSSTKEELDNVLKENKLLRDKISDGDSQTNLLREARARVASLLEVKNGLVQELALQKTKSENQDTALKTTYEEKISRLEKELQDQIAINKESAARINRENESLHLRINQLSRQLGLQQSAKPSTSSVAITEKGTISESSPRTANVKPMSGSATVQQSATVTPWRGSDTPLASIRPISVQNSRTAAILPTSQQPSAGSSSTTSSTSSATSSATGSNAGAGNTALVPPQQQVHTTGNSSLESIASSSPTSSHTDYMPSTSTAAVAVAAIPPMGTSSAAESSQEAESVQQPQQNDTQLYVSGGQQQVVALVSPRVEGSSSTTNTTSTQNTTAPNIQLSQDSNNQQPSTSGSSSSSSTVVSSHSRHTPSSSNVTTTQAGCSSIHKRPRDIDSDCTNTEEGIPEKTAKLAKRLRVPMHSGEAMAHVGDSGMDVDQMPTSSQRDQEDDIVVVDSEEDDGLADGDDEGPIEGGEVEQEGYEDSYEQDQEIDDNECPEALNEDGSMQIDASEQDNNEVDVDECAEQQAQCSSGSENAASGNVSVTIAGSSEPDNQQQQSQAISSGSGETNTTPSIPQSAATGPWKQASSSTNDADIENKGSDSAPQESVSTGSNLSTETYTEKSDPVEGDTSEEPKKSNDDDEATNTEESAEADEDFGEETTGTAETSEQLDSESHQSSSTATQSEIQDNQLSQIEGNSEENEGADGVTSEGEKQAVEGVEEEGREAEASTSATIKTRSKTSRGSLPIRKPRTQQRGVNRPTPIIWQEAPGNSRNIHNLRNQEQQPGSPNRNFSPQRGQRGRRTMRRPPGGGNYSNMRYP